MFYEFNQNNSGGNFGPPAVNVIISADSPEDANRRAEEIGLYFDGCSKGMDCSCCGDRWYPEWSGEQGDRYPKVYGKNPREYIRDSGAFLWGTHESLPEVIVYYKTGRVKEYYAN